MEDRSETARDQPKTIIQNQTKRSESSQDQHKIIKPNRMNCRTNRDQPKTIHRDASVVVRKQLRDWSLRVQQCRDHFDSLMLGVGITCDCLMLVAASNLSGLAAPPGALCFSSRLCP